MKKKYFVLLGSPDPEMNMIEFLLRSLDIPFAYAAINGWRCHAGNVYRADPIMIPKNARLVVVECEPRNYFQFTNPIRIDHHRPEIDLAACMGPSDSWSASSIGQMFRLLKKKPQREAVLVGCADHTFVAAAQGMCPEVEPADVIAYRIREILQNSDSSRNLINRHMDTFRRVMDRAPIKVKGQQEVLDLRMLGFNKGYSDGLLLLQTVLAMDNIAALVCSSHYKGGQKRILITGHAYPYTVKNFMEHWAPKHNLENIFGVELRNYAGASIPLFGK